MNQKRQTTEIRPWAVSALLAGLCWLVVVAGCGRRSETQLEELAPNLRADVRQHLVADDDSSFARYCRQVGVTALFDARLILRSALATDSSEAYAQTWLYMEPHLRRLNSQLAQTYASRYELDEHERWARLDPETARALLLREAQLDQIYLDPNRLLADKIHLLEELRREFERHEHWAGVVTCEYASAEFAAVLGREGDQTRHLLAALRIARRERMPRHASRVLSLLGERYRDGGVQDSMAASWGEALEIAERHRLPEQAATVYTLWADYYADRGRLALAADLYRAAQEVCRDFRGGYHELRFVLEAMYFHAEMGFWGVVGQLLDRARVLHRESAQSPRPIERRIHALRLSEMEARYLSGRGLVDEAEELYQRLEQETEEPTFRLNYPRLMYARAEGLITAGRFTEALPVIGKGLVQALARSLPGTQARFTSLLARVLWKLGNYRAAEQALDDFADLAGALGPGGERMLRREWIFHAACSARLALVRGRRDEARREIARGLTRLDGYLPRTDASAEGYIFLDSCRDLREAMHAYLGSDPRRTYALEFGWRELAGLLGSGSRTADGSYAASPVGRTRVEITARLADILDDDEAPNVEAFLRYLQSRGASHCLYAETTQDIVRWTAQGEDIRVDTLGVSPTEVRERLRAVTEQLSTDPGTADLQADGALAVDLAQLAKLLLPAEILDLARAGRGEGHGQEFPLVLVSPEGLLELLPFEALNVDDAGGYRPLLAGADVAYLRQMRFETPRMSGPRAVIVSNPAISPVHERRYPALGHLSAGEAEARLVSEHFPNALVLSGSEATQARILAAWEDAPLFYATAHFVRDPELPYITFLPVSPPPGRFRPDQTQLGVLDIRGLDLQRCHLVVLSGCATGTPYLDLRVLTPSLGDACLDAGAAMAIETFWTVRDTSAGDLMSNFLRRWAGAGDWSVRALSAARRDRLEGPRGVRHPYGWAAYSITLGHL